VNYDEHHPINPSVRLIQEEKNRGLHVTLKVKLIEVRFHPWSDTFSSRLMRRLREYGGDFVDDLAPKRRRQRQPRVLPVRSA
jgi:hypothetical protein